MILLCTEAQKKGCTENLILNGKKMNVVGLCFIFIFCKVLSMITLMIEPILPKVGVYEAVSGWGAGLMLLKLSVI